jgi:hypothetical protein
MRTVYALLAALSFSLIHCASAKFCLKDQWIGEDFYQGWNWETANDPTHGRVNYVSKADAIRKNLTYGPLLLPSRVRVLTADRLSTFSGWKQILYACGRCEHR